MRRSLGLALAAICGAFVCSSSWATASLWNDGFNLVADRLPSKVGDLVTIVVEERATLQDSLQADSKKDSKANVSDGTGLLSFIKGLGLNASNSFSGSDSVKNNKTLSTRISALVVEVLPNGNLVVEGTRRVSAVDSELTAVVRGVVRPQDVRPDNTVPSYLLANAEVIIKGKGVSSTVRKPGIITQILNVLF